MLETVCHDQGQSEKGAQITRQKYVTAGGQLYALFARCVALPCNIKTILRS